MTKPVAGAWCRSSPSRMARVIVRTAATVGASTAGRSSNVSATVFGAGDGTCARRPAASSAVTIHALAPTRRDLTALLLEYATEHVDDHATLRRHDHLADDGERDVLVDFGPERDQFGRHRTLRDARGQRLAPGDVLRDAGRQRLRRDVVGHEVVV